MSLTSVTSLFEFILGLAALIVLHEFGHYIVSKLFKVEVEEFGIGFPPRMVKLFEAGGTQFTLNWIPLGGFVRPKGENDPTVPGGLAAASPWARLAVLVAGPMMNILLGVVLGVLAFYQVGDPITDKVIIQQIAVNSPADQAGLQPGDLIVAINGQPIDGIERIQALISANLGKPTEVTVDRNGQNVTVSLTPRDPPPPEEGAIGIMMSHPTRPISLGQAIMRGSTAAYQNATGILALPFRLAQGTASPEEGRLVGYKGMFDIYQQIQSRLWFFMAITISLGVVNLLPIPALDGGRILLTLPEILLRRRIPPQYENMIHLIGFALLLILIIYINVQDFLNPLQLP